MTRKALVVGIKNYPNYNGKGKRSELPKTVNDAKDIARYLRDYGNWEITFLPASNEGGLVTLDPKGLVTVDDLEKAIYKLFVQQESGNFTQTALLFFAGHGLQITKYDETLGYLATSETNYLEKSGIIPFWWLSKQLLKSKIPEQIIWLDCCHSGQFTKEIFEQAYPSNKPYNEEINRSFIAACRSSEIAHGLDNHGFLTHLLLDNLNPKNYPNGYRINSLELQTKVDQGFSEHPKFKTYSQRPTFFHSGRPIEFWQGYNGTKGVINNIDIDALVKEIRLRISNKIEALYGIIQLLDIAYPIPLYNLYINVNFLAEPNNYSRFDIDELLQNEECEEENLTGIEVVEQYPRLIILGNMGSGKTTFLKHLIIKCNKGDLFANKIPIFIRLRDLNRNPDTIKEFKLKTSITNCLESYAKSEVECLLERGRFFLLLDGLDEVIGLGGDIIIDEIEKFVEKYPQNRLIISCRNPGVTYLFQGFCFVEIANFNSAQVKLFAQKYFTETNKNVEIGNRKALQFWDTLQSPSNKEVFDLAKRPIFLNIFCKVFNSKSKLYSSFNKLCEQGLELIIKEWDNTRKITRQSLSHLEIGKETKLDIMGYLAYRKSKTNQNIFFEQAEILEYISEYLQINLDKSLEVLKELQLQGLIIESSYKIYTFYHGIFKDYLYARWIKKETIN